jgi:triosephosphate isomerase
MNMLHLVCNWKMNPQTLLESKVLSEGVKKLMLGTKNIHVTLLPPSIFLAPICEGYKGAKVSFGVQSFHDALEGVFENKIRPDRSR